MAQHDRTPLAFGRVKCLAHDCTNAGHWTRHHTAVALAPRWAWHWKGDWCSAHQSARVHGWTRHGLMTPASYTALPPSAVPPPPPKPSGTSETYRRGY